MDNDNFEGEDDEKTYRLIKLPDSAYCKRDHYWHIDNFMIKKEIQSSELFKLNIFFSLNEVELLIVPGVNQIICLYNKKKTKLFKEILKLLAHYNFINSDGMTVLHTAINNKNWKEVKSMQKYFPLINMGALSNKFVKLNYLHLALKHDAPYENIEQLINHGCDLFGEDSYKSLPITYSIKNDSVYVTLKIAEEMLKKDPFSLCSNADIFNVSPLQLCINLWNYNQFLELRHLPFKITSLDLVKTNVREYIELLKSKIDTDANIKNIIKNKNQKRIERLETII